MINLVDDVECNEQNLHCICLQLSEISEFAGGDTFESRNSRNIECIRICIRTGVRAHDSGRTRPRATRLRPHPPSGRPVGSSRVRSPSVHTLLDRVDGPCSPPCTNRREQHSTGSWPSARASNSGRGPLFVLEIRG